MERTIVITKSDLDRLRRLLESARRSLRQDQRYLELLEQELEQAEVMDGKVPSDVVTMNSRVQIRDLDNGRRSVYQLVFPRDADVAKDRISVLAPIGSALLGYRAGDTIEWPVPGGKRRFKVESVLYQPEAAGAAA